MELNEKNIKLIKLFLLYVKEKLNIQTNVHICLVGDGSFDFGPSAGAYSPGQPTVFVNIKNRAMADNLRSLSHELCHHKQNELNQIGPNDTDNQELEDEANTWSGRLVRWFGRIHPEIYDDIK